MKKTILSLTLLLAVGLAIHVNAQVSVGISVRIAPPAIPVYVQPPCPVEGYLWVPGYWAWDEDMDDYYWVPGYWSAPPMIGYYWTPGYWGWIGGVYRWHVGYWGPHVGYYGGINYGCGYGGSGYCGPGGVNYRPSVREQVAMNDRHIERTSVQAQHQQMAMRDRGSFASLNHGRPATPAVTRPVMNRPGAGPVNRPRPEMSRPRPQFNRPQPQGRPRVRFADPFL